MRRIGVLLLAAMTALPVFAEVPKCKLTKVAELPVTLEHNRPLIPAKINGQDVFFLIDTGSYATFIRPAAAAALGLEGRDLEGDVIGVDGAAGMGSVMIDDLVIDRLHLRNKPYRLHGSKTEKPSTPLVAGVLGNDMWSHFDVEFDLAHNLVTLFKPQDCDHANLAYWSPDYLEADFIHTLNAEYHHVTLRVQVNGQPVKAVLDSGATVSALTLEGAKLAGIGPDSPGVSNAGTLRGSGGKEIPAWSARFDRFELAGEAVKNVTLRFADMFDHENDFSSLRGTGLILGVDFIKSHRLLISHSQDKIYFTFNGGRIFAD